MRASPELGLNLCVCCTGVVLNVLQGLCTAYRFGVWCYGDSSAYEIRVSFAASLVTLVVSALSHEPESIQVRFVTLVKRLSH